MKWQVQHLWATRRTLVVLVAVGLVCLLGAGVVVAVTWNIDASTRADDDAARAAVQENESARRAKLQKARQLAGELRFAEALQHAQSAEALGKKATRMNQELWTETYDLVKELTWKAQVAQLLEAWLGDMAKGSSTSGYWATGSTPSTLFSVRSWKLLQLKGKELGPVGARVRVDSSTKGGIRITKDWDVLIQYEGSGGYKVQGMVAQ